MKGLKFQNELVEFLVAIVIRGLASAVIKSYYISKILGKSMKLKKTKINFTFHAGPSVALYLICYIGRNYLIEYIH